MRISILDLLLERAATVTELATALDRPKSTVAHHVGVLLDAGLIRIVGSRRVRAINERFYGRTARLFQVGSVDAAAIAVTNDLVAAAEESADAHRADRLRAVLRHARISARDAAEFWDEVADVVDRFSAQPLSGDQTFGFVVGLYPTSAPVLPSPEPDNG